MAKICPYCGCELEKISYSEWFCQGCAETFFSDSPKKDITEVDSLGGWDDEDDEEEDD